MNLPAKELWDPFIAKLVEYDLAPEPPDPKETYVEYDLDNGGRRQITFKTFANVVYESRKKE